MGESGGMLSRDRIRTVMEAADRLEDLDERVAIMEEGCVVIPPEIHLPDEVLEGDALGNG